MIQPNRDVIKSISFSESPWVVPVTRVDGRVLRPGPIAARARALYWDFAHA